MGSSPSSPFPSPRTSRAAKKLLVGCTKAVKQDASRISDRAETRCRGSCEMLERKRYFRPIMSRSSLTFLLLLLAVSVCDGLFKGDLCSIDGASGVCKLFKNCPSVHRDLQKGKIPITCGYEGYESIVCCPSDRPAPSPRPETFSDRRSVARRKCADHAKSVYTTEYPPILTGERIPLNVSLCALKSRTLIIGGTKAHPREFPHMAAIGFNAGESTAWNCGGTLISDRFVMTAAHCLYDSTWGGAVRVRLGDLNLERSDDDAKPQEFRIIEKIKHPNYKPPSVYHDIALVKTDREVEFNAWIRPACLPYSLPDLGTQGKAVTTGWGWTNYDQETSSSDLMKVTVKLVSYEECNPRFQANYKLNKGIVEDWQICAGERGKDSCQGDSGGPLAIFNQDEECMYSVIGITSVGLLCDGDIPGIYIRVHHYLSWIEKTVWPNAF